MVNKLIAGFVDALGYLELARVFTAHMSGNAASLGAHAGQCDWREAMVRGLAIPPFVLGVALGVLADAWAGRSGGRARLWPAFGLELVCLAVFLGVDATRSPGEVRAGTARFFVLVSLLALAMGLQNATLRRVGEARVRTTFVTGMLTDMTENGVRWVLRRWSRGAGGEEKPFGRLAVLFGMVFVSFMIGAGCGGFGQTAWGARALLAPMVGLLVVMGVEGRNARR